MNNRNAKKAISAGSSEKFVVTGREIDGLAIYMASAPASTDIIEVQLQPKEGEVSQLIPRMGMDILSNMSELEYGNTSDTTDSTYMFYIPLGHVDLDDNDRLVITITNEHATTAVIYNVYEVTGDDDIDFQIKRIVTTEFNQKFNDVESIYLIKSAGFSDADDLDIMIESDQGNVYTDELGIIAETRIFGEIPAGTICKAVKLYENTDEIPDSVGVNITGTTTNIYLVIVQRLLDSKRTSRSIIKRVHKRIQKTAVLKSRNLSKYRALKRRGVIEPVHQLQTEVKKLNVK